MYAGCISSTIYPDMRWHGRLLFIFWFLAMLFVPKTIAKPLTEKLLYPEERSRLIKKMVAVIHTRSFIPTVQGAGKQRERIKDMSRCIVVTYLESLGSPGGGTVGCLQIAHHMQKLGVEVILIPISRGPIAVEKPPGCIISAQPSRLHYLLDGLSVAKAVRSVIAKRQVDAVLSWAMTLPLCLGF
jgi:hypothetical protein